MHDLREGLFLGKEGANSRLQLMYHRYGDKGLSKLIEQNGDKKSLFRKVVDDDKKCETRFLDALDVARFWGEVS